LTFLWKREGGTDRGAATLGKCIKTSGLARHFAECDIRHLARG
jgi:hypothetical protein